MENLGPLSEVASANQRPLMNSPQRMPRREKEGSSQGALARHPILSHSSSSPTSHSQEAGFGEEPRWLSAEATGGQTVATRGEEAAPSLMNFNERRPCPYPSQ